MSILTLPYDSLSAQVNLPRNLETELTNYLLKSFDDNRDLIVIRTLGDRVVPVPIVDGNSTRDIPIFNHPYLIASGGQQYLCFDLRSSVKSKEDDLGYSTHRVTRLHDYLSITLRTLITGEWYRVDNKERLQSKYTYAGVVYANWLGDNITSRYALTLQHKLTITSICHLYWQTMFSDEIIDRVSAGINTANVLRHNERSTIELFESINKLNDLTDLINVIKQVVDDRRLDTLTKEVLQQIISTSWIGNNGRELCLVGVEHPPTFVSMTYIALTERSTRNSLLSRVVKKYNKPNQDSFIRDLGDMINTQINTTP